MEIEQKFEHKCKTTSTLLNDSENHNGSFDCNICLDFANDPVVTLCGHLYCWPCIYKWFHVQSASLPSDEYPQCPVCKAEVSHTTVIPLYGRGQSPPTDSKDKSKPASQATVTPPRPRACGTRALLNAASQPTHQILLPRRNPYQGPYGGPPEEVVSPTSSPLFSRQVSNPVSNVFQPAGAMFGEMVYARVFGNSQSLYTYPNSYHVVGNSSPRIRRHQMQADKSLSRISLFLLCCFILCLMLF